MLVGVRIGGEPITISGYEYWPLALDEQTVLTGYRLLRDQGAGSLAVEFRDGSCTRWDVHPNIGSAKALNEAIVGRRRLME